MTDYQIASLMLGAFYSCIELIKWVYNKSQPALNTEETRKLDVMYSIVAQTDSNGRPLVFRDSADQTQLQKETVSEMRNAIHELGQLVRDTNENVRDTNKILQAVLLRKPS